jgi:NADP-dependent 3-hydroxyisobutyrate dehydrogenase-like protein
MPGDPLVDGGRLVGGEVVAHDVDVEFRGDGLVDGPQELQVLGGAVACQVLAATPLGAQAERRRAAIEAGDYPPRFPLTLAEKDAQLIADAAAGAGADLRLIAAAGTWLAEAERAGLGNQDYTAMLKTILSASGSGSRA